MSRTLGGLTKIDWEEQKSRIHNMVMNLRERKFITTGYDFPDPDSKLLAIAEGRRLPACVMFLDICGFSKHPMESAAEQDMTLRIIALFFSEMIRIAETYDGQIEKNTGDGLMVYFSDIDNPATKKAVACALTMKAATSYLINPIISSTHEQTIQFRISMDYGYITVARIGAKKRFSSYVAIGTTANIASKMLRYTKADQIILGEFARQQLPIDWQYKYTEILPFPTDWKHKTTMLPYSFFLYTGRWANLV